MAEFVELRIERGIDELLELERVGLFSSNEIRMVIKKRKEMEYRLQRMRKCKDDHLKYISYENSLLQLIRVRRKKVGFQHRFKEIERSIATRIAGKYRAVVHRNPSDVQLWLSYIEFCRKQKWSGTVSSLFGKMLQVHSKKEEIWVLAARWESQYNDSIDTARSLMQRALRFNPNSRTLFREYFCLELMYADKIIKRRAILQKKADDDADENERDDSIMSGAVAAVVYETAVQRISEPDFAIQLIGCLNRYGTSFKGTLEGKLVEDVKGRFPDSEEVIQLLCEREIESTSREDVLAVVERVYKDAIQKKPTLKMWTFYLKCLLRQLATPEQSFRKKEIVEALTSSFGRAFENDCLSVDMFSEWVLLYKALIHGSSRRKESLRKALDDVLVRATNKWRANPSVWKISLSVKIETGIGSPEEVHRFFQRGLVRLSAFISGHDSVSDEGVDAIREYVEMYIQWSTSAGRIAPKTILNILDLCCNGKVFSLANTCGRALTSHFQDLILTVAHRIDSFDAAFRFYQKYKDRQPINPAIFNTMLRLSQSIDHSTTVEIFEDYLNEFGKDDHRIWMEYVRYMIDHEEMTAIADIHDHATRMLKDDEQALFLAAYSLLMTNL